MEPQNLTIRDWKVPRYVVNPCPICKAEMLKTMNGPDPEMFREDGQ